MLCLLGLHKWSGWENYVAFNGISYVFAGSSIWQRRRCKKCGREDRRYVGATGTIDEPKAGMEDKKDE